MTSEPTIYRRGLVRLLPQRHRQRVDAALQSAGRGLGGWLHGQEGLLFGPIGAVFATPLVLAGRILVLRLYVEDVLEGERSTEGEGSEAHACKATPPWHAGEGKVKVRRVPVRARQESR